jgi:hypothetical protein
MKYLLLCLILICGCSSPQYNLHTEDITDMYVDYIEGWKSDCKKAFKEASEEVYKKKPDENIVGPHEDPNKCICKGTGVIIQGDDHKTPCPFHSKSQGLNVTHKEVIIKEFRK